MPIGELESWLDEYSREGTVWYAKRLSGNDTLANDSHQAGPYIPKGFLFQILPQLNDPQKRNPDTRLPLHIDSHGDFREVRAIWYNNALCLDRKAKARGRNETRITGFGGQQSALLNPESTGSVAVFVFLLNAEGIASDCHVWICRNTVEEELVESRIGPIEPRLFVVWRPGREARPEFIMRPAGLDLCKLATRDMPKHWLSHFPSGREIIAKTYELRPDIGLPVDQRLVRRRDCEFEIFKSVETAFYLPRIGEGFKSVDSFLSVAQTILQSRKSRSGNSLELHAKQILTEEKFVADTHFSHSATIEGNKRPDFLFPNAKAYRDPKFPEKRLRMLAAKTTVKDRWRQILNEANRIETKHLLTLQEGVSENQFKEMREANVQLVVPKSLHERYPKSVQPHLMTLDGFISEVRHLQP
jgi:hypothetical protein